MVDPRESGSVGQDSSLFLCPGKNEYDLLYPVNGLLADGGGTFEPSKIRGVTVGSANRGARVS